MHCLSDAKGRPLVFKITEGQTHDSKIASEHLQVKKYQNVLADAAYSNTSIRNLIAFRGAKAVIANSKRHIKQYECDKEKYKARNEIKRFFGRLKHFRGIATRYIKKGRYFLQCILFASFIICSRFDDST